MSHVRPRLVLLASLIVTAALLAADGLRAQQHDHDNPEHFAAIFKALDLKPGAIVADIGAGDGAYTTKMAAAIGSSGKVVAVDVNPVALDRLRARITRDRLSNVAVVQGDTDNPKLEPGSLDAALIVNAYHEMSEFNAMLTHIRAALKPSGRLVIVEPISPRYRSAPRAEQTERHQIALEYVLPEIRAAGFRVIGLEDPFVGGHSHDTHQEWMMTMTPAATTPAPTAATPARTPGGR
jgi:ubiquinone/menaquinone biosynthesis C-methylase UbiE